MNGQLTKNYLDVLVAVMKEKHLPLKGLFSAIEKIKDTPSIPLIEKIKAENNKISDLNVVLTLSEREFLAEYIFQRLFEAYKIIFSDKNDWDFFRWYYEGNGYSQDRNVPAYKQFLQKEIIQALSDGDILLKDSNNSHREKVEELRSLIIQVENEYTELEHIISMECVKAEAFGFEPPISEFEIAFIKENVSVKTNDLKKYIQDSEELQFSKWLKETRKSKGMTLKELAAAADLSHTYISKIENGERGVPSYEILKNISAAFNMPLYQVLARASIMPEKLPTLSELIKANEFEFRGNRVTEEQRDTLTTLLAYLDKYDVKSNGFDVLQKIIRLLAEL